MYGTEQFKGTATSTNHFRIAGKVVHYHVVPDTDKTKLFVTLATSGVGEESNFPCITLYDDVAESFLGYYDKGDNVTIEGRVRSNVIQEEGEKRYNQWYVGDTCRDTVPAINSVFDVSTDRITRHDDENTVVISGYIHSVFQPEGYHLVRLKIRVVTDKYVDYVELTLFGDLVDDVLANCCEDQAICALGYISTRKTERDGEVRHYKGITGTHLARITVE